MTARRWGWGLWLLLAAALHLFGHTHGTLALLGASLLYTLLAPLAVWAAARKLEVSLELAPEGLAGTVALAGKLPPLCRAIGELRARNGFTGEEIGCALALEGGKPAPFSAEGAHCGRVEVWLERVCLRDPLGLAEKNAFPRQRRARVILPPAAEVHLDFGPRLSDALTSEQSSNRAGMDPGETRAIREYRPGDPLNTVHWKLTEKADRLLVRELTRPAENGVLLLLAPVHPAPEQAHALAGLLLSLSLALVREGHAHTLGWWDGTREEKARRPVQGEGDAWEALAALLSTPIAAGGGLSVDEAGAYAHTIAVCDAPLDNAFPERVTLLTPSAGSDTFQVE